MFPLKSAQNKTLFIFSIWVSSLTFLPCSANIAFAKTAQEYYKWGEVFFNQENYQSALDSFNKAITTAKPSGQVHARAHLLRGVIYHDIYRNYPQAIRDYRDYLTQPDADRAIAVERLAGAYFDLGMLYRCLFHVAVNLQVDYYTYKLELATLLPDAVTPDELPYLRYFRGFCYYLSGRFDEAIVDLKSVAQQTPVSSLAQLKLAACYHRVGQTEQAAHIFAQVKRHIDKDPKHPQSVAEDSELWRTRLELGKLTDTEEAMQECKKAVNDLASRQPKEIAPLNRAGRNLSYVHYVDGDVEGALVQLEMLDFTVPDFVVALSEFFAKRLKTSASTTRDVLQNFNVLYYDPSIFQQKSYVYFELAHRAYANLSALSDLEGTKLQIGLCYLYTNQFGRAIPIFEELQTVGSSKFLAAQAGIYLGVCTYLSDGEGRGKERTSEIWEGILKSFQGDKAVHSEMAHQWAKLGINLKALLPLYTALEIDLPEVPEMYTSGNVERYGAFTRQLGYVYLQMGIHEEDSGKRIQYVTNAILHLEKNHGEVGYLFGDPLLLVDLAQAYYHRRLFEVSAEILQNFKGRYPEMIQISTAIQVISEIAIGVWPKGQMPSPQWVTLY